MTELTKEQRIKLWQGKCADCNGILLEGPSGGASINYKCDTCGHKFNVCDTYSQRIK